MTSLIPNFHGDIVTPSDPSYINAISRWAVNAARHAKIVTFPKDEDDVALAIAYAKDNNLSLAIRGGGHNPGGASSVKDGLVIDLSKYFSGVRIDPENKRAYVGGGALWETVDKEGMKHGLAAVAGSVNHTGVGGLTLGGGYGWLTGEHGLVIDNLIQATVITASGTPHTASATVNPDLFFGIRGAGCNFGVITEFVYQLHPQRAKVFAGMLFYPPTALYALVGVTPGWLADSGGKAGMVQLFGIGPDGNPMISVFMFYNGSEEEGKEKFKCFFDIFHIPIPDGPETPTPSERPYEDVNSLLNHFVPHGNGYYTKSVAHASPDALSTSAAFQHLIKMSLTPPLRATLMFEYFPFSKIISVPNGETAYLRAPNWISGTMVTWKHDDTVKETIAAVEGRARTLAHELCALLGHRGTKDGLTPVQNLGYANLDSATGEVNKAQVLFGVNYPRLQAVKKRYDPENIFNKWFPITPA